MCPFRRRALIRGALLISAVVLNHVATGLSQPITGIQWLIFVLGTFVAGIGAAISWMDRSLAQADAASGDATAGGGAPADSGA